MKIKKIKHEKFHNKLLLNFNDIEGYISEQNVNKQAGVCIKPSKAYLQNCWSAGLRSCSAGCSADLLVCWSAEENQVAGRQRSR